jgi:xylulokinase
LGAGIFGSESDAFRTLKRVQRIDPDPKKQEKYSTIYEKWKEKLQSELNK